MEETAFSQLNDYVEELRFDYEDTEIIEALRSVLQTFTTNENQKEML